MGIETAMVASIISAGVGAASSVIQGQQQQRMANYQAEQANADAFAEKQAALLEAERLRSAGKKQRSAAMAAMAGSGVRVDQGTALVIDKDISEGAEYDAGLAIFGGEDRTARLGAQAQASRARGKQAKYAGYMNAGSTLLSSGASIHGRWRKMR